MIPLPAPPPGVRYFGVGGTLHASYPDGTVARYVVKNVGDVRRLISGYVEEWEAIPAPDPAALRAKACRCADDVGPCGNCARTD